MDSRQYTAYPPLLIRNNNPTQQPFVNNNNNNNNSSNNNNINRNHNSNNYNSTAKPLSHSTHHTNINSGGGGSTRNRQLIVENKRPSSSLLSVIKEEYNYPFDHILNPNSPRRYQPQGCHKSPPLQDQNLSVRVLQPQQQQLLQHPTHYPYIGTLQQVHHRYPIARSDQQPYTQQVQQEFTHNPNMNSGAGYNTVPKNVTYNNSVPSGPIPLTFQQQQPQQELLSTSPYSSTSSYSTSPYSSSPHPSRGSYPNSPAQQPGQYMPQKSTDSTDLLTNEVLKILAEKDTPPVQNNQAVYQSPTSGQPQQRGGYIDPQNYSQSPPNLLYYPYHRDFLNSASEQEINNYSVKLPGGVMHQYPTPDYLGHPQQQPPPDYPSSTGEYMPTSKQNPNRIQNQSYNPPDLNNSCYQSQGNNSQASHYADPQQDLAYQNQPQQQQQSPQQQQTRQLPQQNQQHVPSGNATQQPNQYDQYISHIALKQEALDSVQKQPVYQHEQNQQQQTYIAVIPPSDFNSYRSTGLDSPQGSPMPATSQTSPNVYQGPSNTPPLQRKSQPARQISNETYSVGSPSNQLSIGDMSLNSPRPRSETVEMEAPTLPPRSPNPPQSTLPDTNYLDPNIDAKSMPPPSQIPVPSSNTFYPTPQTQSSPQVQNDRRLRSGTVEMIDVPQSRPLPPGAAPSQRYLPSQNFPQRSRAGTVEMIDSPGGTLNLPEQRIRSGTVEMADTAVPVMPSSTSMQLPPRGVVDSKIVPLNIKTSEYNNQNVSSQGQASSVKSPPPYTSGSSGPGSANSSSPQSPVIPTINSSSSASLKQGSPSGPQTAPTNQKLQNGNNVRYQTPPYSNQQYQTPPKSGSTYVQSTPPLQPYSNVYPTTSQQQQFPARTNLKAQLDRPAKENVMPDGNYIIPINGQMVPSPNSSYDGLGTGQQSPSSKLENAKLYQQQQQSVKQEYSGTTTPTTSPTTSVVSEQELNQQQKVMQQQYIQRVQQAQLQQQLRQLQNEYENSLQVENDIAQEFLREQEFDKIPSYDIHKLQQLQLHHPVPSSNNYVSQHLQHSPQQQQQPPPPPQQQQPPQHIQPLQHPYAQYPTSNGLPRSYLDQQNSQSSQPLPSQQQPRQRVPYIDKDVPVFPVTGLPINQPSAYQTQRQPYQPQMQHPQQRNIGSQPIVIMPGGGSFSNPGQFIPTSNVSGPPRKEQAAPHPRANQRTPASSGGGKQQTPFQKLRKIAEEISSFVDDVVKFKGKKGDHEYKYLEEMLTQQLLLLDKVAASGTDELRNARKALVKEVQELLEILLRRSTQRN